MALGDLNVFIAAGFVLSVSLACAPTESAGECTATKACTIRGEACNLDIQVCEPQDLTVDATSDQPTPAAFAGVALPFFRGEVCMPTRVRPGDRVPVSFSPCLHPCMTEGGYLYKQQYSCASPTYCDAAVLQFYTGANGTGCPADAFGSFDRSQCKYPDKPIPGSAGPFTLSSGAVRGNAQVEIPFLSNDDTAAIRDGAGTEEIWELIQQYPQASERVFAISLDAANPSAPADCSDKSLCTCREIGF